MARGVAGYGRYDDDKAHVGCPWARSDMSPCAARDGKLALGGEPPEQCVACGLDMPYLIRDLALDWAPARDYMITGRPVQDAELFRRLVWEATKSPRPGPVREGRNNG